MPRITDLLIVCAFCLVLLFSLLRPVTSSKRDGTHTMRGSVVHSGLPDLETPASVGDGQGSEGRASATKHAVFIRKPEGPPRIELVGADPQGRIGSVACSTCHAVREPNFDNISPEFLDEFHQGLTFNHGQIACYACHNPDHADALRLADGTSLEYENVMTLCAQCHGPQATAFAHGAHGGMNGHWDLTRGPQLKNNCVDCHDPHEPAYPKMIVGFKPKDRFNAPASNDGQHAGGDAHDNH